MSTSFILLLREYRDRRRLTQSRLAELAGFDHSYVSRLETGTRQPARQAVDALADALALSDAERDALLSSAGFMPTDIGNLWLSEPILNDLHELLADRSVPAVVRDDVRCMVSLLIQQARRTRVDVALAAD